MSEASAPKRVTRRTVAKGAAWTVPAIAVAGAAPAMAASPPEPIIPSYQPGSFCKHSSDDQGHAVFCFDNTTDDPITITLGTMFWNNLHRQSYFSIGGAFNTQATVPANTNQCFWVDSGIDVPWPNLGNAIATQFFTYPGALGGLNADGTPTDPALTPSITTAPNATMSNCNSHPGQPGDSAPHPTSGP